MIKVTVNTPIEQMSNKQMRQQSQYLASQRNYLKNTMRDYKGSISDGFYKTMVSRLEFVNDRLDLLNKALGYLV